MCDKCNRKRCCKKKSCCEDECCPKPVYCKGEKGDQGPMGPRGTALGYAEFINSDGAQSATPNINVATGTAFTIDTEVVNSVNSGITKTAGNGGTVFRLTYSGTYEINYELSPNMQNLTGGAVDLALGATIGTMVIDPTTLAGSNSLSWVHGRALVKITTPTYVMLTPDPSTTPMSVGPAGGAATNRVVRMSIVQISL